MHVKFPTAAIAVLGFDVGQWSDLPPGGGKLLAFQRPRDLA
jgi:phosphohistidine phosphatase